MSNRFVKYRKDSRPLWKPEPGESRTATLEGVREHEGRSGPMPVLDLVNDEHGQFTLMCSSASFVASLVDLDPQDDETVTITRGFDIANGDKTSRTYTIEREEDS